MRRASLSLFSCLAVVPDDTSEWNPLIVPQAMVTNNSGNSGVIPRSPIARSLPKKPMYAPIEESIVSGWAEVPSSVPTMIASSAPPTPEYSRNDER
jgi:hypothetical protein